MHGRLFERRGLSTSSVRCNEDDGLITLKTNPYFNKYSQKITEFQKTTPDELLRRFATFREKNGTYQQGKSGKNNLSQTSAFTKKKNLYDIMHRDLLQDKSTEETSEIWLRHHASVKDTISVVISAEVYESIHRTTSKHPTFLLPLPRHHGYEYFVSQSCGHEFHLTPLINFQTFKENAPECLALTHFTELIDNKHIVLMRGEFNHDVLNVSEAMCLANQLHRYYGEMDIQRQKVLERFTYAPTEFQHMDLIVELERMAS